MMCRMKRPAINFETILLVITTCLSFILLIPGIALAKQIKAADPLPDFKTTPSLRWKFHTNQPILSSPIISENSVYVGGLDSVLYSIDIQTGKVNWKFVTGGEIRSNVLVDKEQVFLVGGDGTFYSVNKSSGKIIWKWVCNKTD